MGLLNGFAQGGDPPSGFLQVVVPDGGIALVLQPRLDAVALALEAIIDLAGVGPPVKGAPARTAPGIRCRWVPRRPSG